MKTNIIDKLPKTPGIMGRKEYFNSAVMILIANMDNKEYIILQKRAKHIRQGGEISLPGGKYEDDDITFLNTAIRESSEELGISKDDINIIGQMDTLITTMGALIEIYIGEINIPNFDYFKPNKQEVESLLFFPMEDLKTLHMDEYSVIFETKPSYKNSKGEITTLLPSKELNLPVKYHKPWVSGKKPVYLFKYDSEIVWGITAQILLEFKKIL